MSDPDQKYPIVNRYLVDPTYNFVFPKSSTYGPVPYWLLKLTIVPGTKPQETDKIFDAFLFVLITCEEKEKITCF